MSEELELELEKVDNFLPPTIVEVNSGRWAVVGGRWYPIPNTVTLEMLREAWKGQRINKIKPTPPKVTEYKVPGSKGETYIVKYESTGWWKCNCLGFGFRRSCKHVDSIKNKNHETL